LYKPFYKLSTKKLLEKRFCFNFLPENVPWMTFKLWKTGQSKDKREKKHKCKMSIDSMADAEPPRLPLFGPLATAHTGFCRDRRAPTTSPSSLHAPLFPSLLWIRLEEDRGKRERGGMASSL